MKVLLIADHELRELWDHWGALGSKRLEGVRLILSAGDIRPEYLEFLVTMLNVPCLYVRGNHDGRYDQMPPEGCIDIDGKIFEAEICEPVHSTDADNSEGCAYVRRIRVAGLGGSMRYSEGRDMYSEREMASRVRRLSMRIKLGLINHSEKKHARRDASGAPVDIFLTHAPCRGYGDLGDLAHTGFSCFNRFLSDFRPKYHCYGHVHMEYARIRRVSEHPSGTQLINVSGMYILDI
ncbi:MAG: metallophosphoesterase [Mogibacterium sp.]|nr:metallophosphoesterase [Mogibacterium sp.]MBQ6438847.1 metallophosphoesterase [Mogibacterium sp.]MBQ6500871.1 metallophosphoesterase [Mogibacterium sp.]MBR4092123.1 metallophosphoesterase [Mogibacterium sp.]